MNQATETKPPAITNDEEHQAGVDRIDELIDKEELTPAEELELEELSNAVNAFEDANMPLGEAERVALGVQQCYEEGKAAYEIGNEKTENPYITEGVINPKSVAWDDGYRDAGYDPEEDDDEEEIPMDLINQFDDDSDLDDDDEEI
jgi:hypothetical protein